MTSAERSSARLLEVAGRVADREGVDWGDFAAVDAPAAEGLRLLDRIAAAFREAGGGRAAGEGARWGSLELLEKLGEGASGEVWRAFDPMLEREVALKLRHAQAPGGAAADARALDEGRRLARVRHPHVLAVYGADVDRGRVGLWTEVVEGRSLEQELAERGSLPPVEVARLGAALARALEAVHGAGLLHGDVKASNVLLEPGGRVVLADFGAGRELAREEIVGSGTIQASPLSLAPEVLRTGTAGAAADLYALGVLLFRLSTGRYPVEAASLDELAAAHRDGRRQRLAALAPGWPRSLVAAIERALEPDPGRRFGDAGVMAAALERAVEQPARRRRNARLAAAVAAVALAGWFGARLATPPAAEEDGFPSYRFRLLAELPGAARDPALAPGGDRLVFALADGGGERDLWTLPAAGGEPVRLTSVGGDCAQPTWAGDRILFARGGDLWEVPAAGGEPRRRLERATAPRLSADGRRLTFLRDRRIWLAAGDGSQARPVDGLQPTLFGYLARAAFAPDGERLVVWWPRPDRPMGDLWVVPLAAGVPRRLTRVESQGLGAPAWTADGRWILWSSDHAGSATLWRVDADGGETIPVTRGAGADGSPAPSRDLARLVYTNERRRATLDRLEPASGEVATVFERRGALITPEISSAGDRATFFARAPEGHRVFVLDLRSGEARPVTAGPVDTHPRWVPGDRALLYYQAEPAPVLRRLELETGRDEVIAAPFRWAAENAAMLAADGRRLVYTRRAGGRLEATVVRDLASGAERELGEALYSPRWVPGDGAVAGSRLSDGRLLVCPADGGPCRELTEGVSVRLSPDGRSLGFLRGSPPRLLRRALGGVDEEVLLALPRYAAVDFGWGFGAAGEVYFHQQRDGAAELWIGEAPDRSPR